MVWGSDSIMITSCIYYTLANAIHTHLVCTFSRHKMPQITEWVEINEIDVHYSRCADIQTYQNDHIIVYYCAAQSPHHQLCADVDVSWCGNVLIIKYLVQTDLLKARTSNIYTTNREGYNWKKDLCFFVIIHFLMIDIQLKCECQFFFFLKRSHANWFCWSLFNKFLFLP